MTQILPADSRPSARLLFIGTRDAHEAGALGFMPRILVLTTLPHSKPNTDRFERVNGRYSLRLQARRSVGLPYSTYPRLILAFLTTQAVRTKSREIDLGRTPNEFARKIGLTPITGKRGTVTRLHDQLQRLFFTRVSWQYTKDFRARESGSAFIAATDSCLRHLMALPLSRKPSWHSKLTLSRKFFREITNSAVPIDLRAVEQLKCSPLAIDIYVWLTYRMSYLRRSTTIPWDGLQEQFGSNYSRPRDFRRRFLVQLRNVIRVYPTVRVSQAETGLCLSPSPPNVQTRAES